MRASSRGALKPIPGVDSQLLSAPEHPQGAAPPTCLAASLRRRCLTVVCREQRAMSFKHAGQLDIYEHLLFELRMPLSGLLASGGRIEERERVPREITWLA